MRSGSNPRSAFLIVSLAVVLSLAAEPVAAQDCPQLIGLWPYGPSWAVTATEGHAYFGSGLLLMVADASDPSAPLVVGSVALPEEAQDIVVAGGYAYVADDYSGLRVIDVSTPSEPTEVAWVEAPAQFWRIAVSGGFAYVAALDDGGCVIDVSVPTAPVLLGCGGSYVSDVAVSGAYLYVLGDDLRVIDVSNPWFPVEVGYVDLPARASGVGISGEYVSVAALEAGLWVIDVSVPSSPDLVGYVDTPGSAMSVAVSGGFAYVADDASGLRAIDVSEPTIPHEVGFFDTAGSASNVEVSGGYVFVADGAEGVAVFRECAVTVFADGFESGDTSVWSATVP